MQDTDPDKAAHHGGGTYAQDDVSPAAERSRFRTTQNYRSTAGQLDEHGTESETGSTEPGSKLDSGAS